MIKNGVFEKSAHGSSGHLRTPLNLESERQKWLSEKLIQITKKTEIWLEADLKQDLGIDSLTFRKNDQTSPGFENGFAN